MKACSNVCDAAAVLRDARNEMYTCRVPCVMLLCMTSVHMEPCMVALDLPGSPSGVHHDRLLLRHPPGSIFARMSTTRVC